MVPPPCVEVALAGDRTVRVPAGFDAATLYNPVRSAKRHELAPFIYLRDLFLRIPTHPSTDIHLLLPDHWKREILPTLDSPPRP
jgi:hypothetical protein